jgi:hypothetical protein
MAKPLEPSSKMSTARPPSRIRRDPVPAEKPQSLEKALWRPTREWEIGLAIVGMILFGLAIDAVTIGFSAITG